MTAYDYVHNGNCDWEEMNDKLIKKLIKALNDFGRIKWYEAQNDAANKAISKKSNKFVVCKTPYKK